MDLQLTNKTVFVSGATAGIGFAIAKGFAKEGAIVYLNGRDQARVDAAIQRIKTETPNSTVHGITADLATLDGFNKLTGELPQADILINNLGIFEPVDFFDLKDSDWQKMFDVNVLSGVRLTQHFMPSMLKNNWGRVIFISSESALQIPTEMIHYGFSKTAQLSIANGLAQLTKGTGVTVNSVLPGPTYSEGVQQFVADLAQQANSNTEEVEHKFFAETRPLSLLQRFATVDEIASSVIYLSSPLAAATNGAALRADGGILKGLH
ncbi:SDR family NAD(P)-dependent oxidoreductase [Mucilaginibacter myungsuensis]|uniref:SDR family oxidoreductase n=1 Tax=Mucilaginibacter myungsuensis TaxID=649104 RepID=A0A929PXQ7_9SPHI|nr:SDR family oxidoreductase [Mucilaginibacter myungsuensis]MBE9664113.1 SDR family oxidoreductase [Mucilaginibacter myungsuensis]MDN3601292.1 SDR family oxidoreductase [Mucilaginibacter myungsuensis]